MHRFLAATLVLLASCGPGQPTYTDRVKALPSDVVHPLVAELMPLLEHPQQRVPDELMRTWKEFLGTTSMPLRQDTKFTFVYYDFSKTLQRVYLEASFAPGRLEPLRRLGSTAFFYRSYEILKPDRVRYRFSDGKLPLPDPFHPDATADAPEWHQAVEPSDSVSLLQHVVGASEARLAGQDVRLVLPPFYRRNLAWTYPVVVFVGEPTDWYRPLTELMDQNAIRPLVAVAVGTNGGSPWTVPELKTALEDRVVPWMRSRYRVSVLPSEMVLIGWGDAVKVTQELAASHTEFWTRVWAPPALPQGADWNSQLHGWLKSQYAVTAP